MLEVEIVKLLREFVDLGGHICNERGQLSTDKNCGVFVVYSQNNLVNYLLLPHLMARNRIQAEIAVFFADQVIAQLTYPFMTFPFKIFVPLHEHVFIARLVEVL